MSLDQIRRVMDEIDFNLMYEKRHLAPDYARIRALQEQRAYVAANMAHLRRLAQESPPH
jgi:hypothetical protein